MENRNIVPVQPNIQPRPPTNISSLSQSVDSSYRDELINEIKILYYPQEIKHLNIFTMTIEELQLLRYLKYVDLKYLAFVKSYQLLQKHTHYHNIHNIYVTANSEFTLSRSYATKKFTLNIKIYFTKKFEIENNTYYLDSDPSQKLTVLYLPLDLLLLMSKIPQHDFIDKVMMDQYFIIGSIKKR
jgi:hypothetical protein